MHHFKALKDLFLLMLLLHLWVITLQMIQQGIKNYNKYFLPRGEIKNYKGLINGGNFYDQSINDIIKQYNEVRKVSIGYGDDYTTGCLLDYAYSKDNCS